MLLWEGRLKVRFPGKPKSLHGPSIILNLYSHCRIILCGTRAHWISALMSFINFVKLSTIILSNTCLIAWFLFSHFRFPIEYVKLSYFILYLFCVFSSYLSLHTSFCTFSPNLHIKVHWFSFQLSYLLYTPSTDFLVLIIIIFHFPRIFIF